MSFARLPQLRIAVNSRCGRACFYCRPSGEALPTSPNTELTAANVIAVCEAAASFGVQDVKITGGDPALWEPLVDCVARLKRDLNLSSVHVISRHPRIGALVGPLADAGADLINISVDTLKPDIHHQITGRPDLVPLLEAVQACVAAGVPCKINSVIMKGINDDEVDDLIAFCERTGVSTLKLLDLIRDLEEGSETFSNRLVQLRGNTPREIYSPLAVIVDRLRTRAISVRTLHQGGLGHPMTSLRLPSGLEVVVKDHQSGAWYGSVCGGCQHYPCHDALMALRLTADARLQFCLLREDVAIDLKPLLAEGSAAMRAAVEGALSVYDSANFLKDSPAFETGSEVGRRRLQRLPILHSEGGVQ